jgi:predicted SprT family Zn-dependent metalloprotease
LLNEILGMTNNSPTSDFYLLFDTIYNFYNDKLFGNSLPQCMFVIVRKPNTFGHYLQNKWFNKEKSKSDEIAINPLMFGKYPLIEILQTLVHEMCHLWQYHFGKPSIRTYHNKQWADKMESIGLMPSNTGQPGGKRTGQQMMDYIIDDGLFNKCTQELLSINIFKKLWYDVSMPYIQGINEELFQSLKDFEDVKLLSPLENDNKIDSVIRNPGKKDKSKIKYTCPNCNTNVWGKIGLNIICGACSSDYLSESEN